MLFSGLPEECQEKLRIYSQRKGITDEQFKLNQQLAEWKMNHAADQDYVNLPPELDKYRKTITRPSDKYSPEEYLNFMILEKLSGPLSTSRYFSSYCERSYSSVSSRVKTILEDFNHETS